MLLQGHQVQRMRPRLLPEAQRDIDVLAPPRSCFAGRTSPACMASASALISPLPAFRPMVVLIVACVASELNVTSETPADTEDRCQKGRSSAPQGEHPDG